jgi:hypothetical protein
MRTNAATDSNDHSQTPTQPIALAYFNRKPVAIDHLLRQDGRDDFVPLAIAATVIAAALLLAFD